MYMKYIFKKFNFIIIKQICNLLSKIYHILLYYYRTVLHYIIYTLL